MDGPDFICFGAQKAGTGWLYEQLRPHPDFWMPPLKELHYFDRAGRSRRELRPNSGSRVVEARRTRRGDRDIAFLDTMEKLRAQPEIDLHLYAALFAMKGDLISGDITPGYSVLDERLVSRITDYLPKTKLLFFARDPVERVWSQLSMWVRHGVIPPLDANDQTAVTEHLARPEIAARSYPSRIVARWRKAAQPDALRVFFFDDLKSNPADVRRQIIQWVGGDPRKPSGDLSAGHNPKGRKEKLKLNDAMRAHLAQFFKDELLACATELGGPAVEWPRRYGL